MVGPLGGVVGVSGVCVGPTVGVAPFRLGVVGVGGNGVGVTLALAGGKVGVAIAVVVGNAVAVADGMALMRVGVARPGSACCGGMGQKKAPRPMTMMTAKIKGGNVFSELRCIMPLDHTFGPNGA